MKTLRQILVLLPLLLSIACERNGAATAATTTVATPVPQPSNPATAPAQSDEEQVLELALLAFAFSGDAVFLKPGGGREKLIVHHQTPGPTGMLSESQLGSDLRSTGQRIPDDVQRSLRERNVKVASLSGMRMVDHRLQIADLDPVFAAAHFDRERKFEEFHPNAFADAHAWLPGFSDDGKEAVVRFWFGPTPHGATATYYLVRRDEGWRIKWHKIAHYL